MVYSPVFLFPHRILHKQEMINYYRDITTSAINVKNETLLTLPTHIIFYFIALTLGCDDFCCITK